MAIRFQCSSCSQPIEVDDEWASRTVACPYCRNTITAPAESTLPDPAHVPVASPIAGGAEETGLPSQEPQQPWLRTGGANRLALVALVLALCSIGFLIIAQLVLAPHRAEREELQKVMMSADNFAKSAEAQSKFFEAHPDALVWIVATFLLVVASGLSSVAGIVCALIALRRPERRGMAVSALIIALVPVFFCCGGLAFGAQG